jgi:hypothetical protein
MFKGRVIYLKILTLFNQFLFLNKKSFELVTFYGDHDYYSLCMTEYYFKTKTLILGRKASTFFDSGYPLIFKYRFFKIRIS